MFCLSGTGLFAADPAVLIKRFRIECFVQSAVPDWQMAPKNVTSAARPFVSVPQQCPKKKRTLTLHLTMLPGI
jgi:hypothetical protein